MFIKEITLFGFKSYKEKTTITDLYDGLNVIVGRNGSGKSNIFSAIEFALTLEYRHLKPETRSAMLYEGRSVQGACEPAYVEIVFDNKDQKLPIPDNEVTFRRVLAVKKDKFYVNGKELTTAKQFLESAGFTNPYFIVKQGKIMDLAHATDATRLRIISDVAGTSVFDDKVAHCKRALEQADAKKFEIEEMLDELKTRQESLEGEASEQSRFIKLDQKKRAVEFILHERKLREIQAKITELEDERAKSINLQEPILKKLETVSRDIQIYKQDIETIELKIKDVQDLNKEYESTRNSISTTLATKNQELADLKQTHKKADTSLLVQLQGEISTVQQQLRQIPSELSDIKKRMEKLSCEKSKLSGGLKEMQETEVFKAMHKGTGHFRKVVEQQLKMISRSLEDTEKRLEALNLQDENDKVSLREEIENLDDLRRKHIQCVKEVKSLNENIQKQKSEENKFSRSLENTWRELSELDKNMAQKRDRLSAFEDECRRSYGRGAVDGWTGIQQILTDFKASGCQEHVVNGYLGLVCEHINCDSQLDMAVEAVGGKRLMYHVVSTHQVAEKLLNEFNTRKLIGEVNFIPLSGLKIRKDLAPDGLKGTKPMMKVINVPEQFAPVASYIFGATLLCDSLETATEAMRKLKVGCVTIDGETVTKEGVMKGGYIARRPQILELQRAKSTSENELVTLREAKLVLEKNADILTGKYKVSKSNYEKLRTKKDRLFAEISKVECAIGNSEQNRLKLQNQIHKNDMEIMKLKSRIEELKEKEKVLKGDAANDKVKLMKDFRKVSREYNEIEKIYMEKISEKSSLEKKAKHLQQRHYNEVETNNANDHEAELHETERLSELIKTLSAQLAEIRNKISETHEEIVSLQNGVLGKKKSLEGLTDREARLKTQLRNVCSKLESFSADYANWLTKREDQKTTGVNLGSVPVNMEQFESVSDKQLYRTLKKVNLELKQKTNDGINQKAREQLEEIKEKYSEFQARMEVSCEEKRELLQLLQDMQQRKGEAMLQNVRELQTQFSEIFRKIVPRGNAELVLYGPNVSVTSDDDIDSDGLKEMAAKNSFKGVKVDVNFTGARLHNNRSCNLVQLSGGQKSIIALCLILAIQTVDPVPFYLFDEVDQAMDDEYRGSVARVVGTMSERSQFICTTFRPEFVDVADKVFGVTYQQKCSRIHTIPQSQGLNFVDSERNAVDSSSMSPADTGSFCHNNSESVIFN